METKDLVVKINYTQEGNGSLAITYSTNTDKANHASKYLICGGMYNRNGGTIVFKAKNIEEATEIANNNLVANAGANASANKYEYLKRDYIVNNM